MKEAVKSFLIWRVVKKNGIKKSWKEKEDEK